MSLKGSGGQTAQHAPFSKALLWISMAEDYGMVLGATSVQVLYEAWPHFALPLQLLLLGLHRAAGSQDSQTSSTNCSLVYSI